MVQAAQGSCFRILVLKNCIATVTIACPEIISLPKKLKKKKKMHKGMPQIHQICVQQNKTHNKEAYQRPRGIGDLK